MGLDQRGPRRAEARLNGQDRSKSSPEWGAIIVPVCLIAFFLVLSTRFLGLSLADNTVELLHGEVVGRYTFLHYFAWSPLYSLWFRMLAQVFPDPLVRYYVSWGFFATALTLIPMLFRVRGAWIYSALITVFPLLLVEPFIGQCASAILVLGLCVVLRRGAPVLFAIGMAFAISFVVAFIRPEFTYGAVLAAASAVGFAAIRSARRSSDSVVAGRLQRRSILVAMLLLAAVVLMLQARSKGKRSGMAVAQHFNLRAAERGQLAYEGEFWNSDYAARAFRVDPVAVRTDVATIVDFVRGNPSLYLRYVLENLLQVRTVTLLICWCGLLLLPWVKGRLEQLRGASVFLLLVTVPSLAGMVLVSPRWHYMVLVIPSLILFGLQMVRLPRLTGWAIPVVVACACALIWLVDVRVMPGQNPKAMEERRDLARVECMREADESRPAMDSYVFDSSATGITYLKRHRALRTLRTAETLAGWTEFQGWIRAVHPLWVAKDESLPARYHVSAAEFDEFLQHEAGYKAHPCQSDAELTVYTSAALAR